MRECGEIRQLVPHSTSFYFFTQDTLDKSDRSRRPVRSYGFLPPRTPNRPAALTH